MTLQQNQKSSALKSATDTRSGRPQAAERPLRERLTIALIHPSNYDHSDLDGRSSYVQTYTRGVIPCNSLRVLHSLTREALERPRFADVVTEVHVWEDSVRAHQRAFRRLVRRHADHPEAGKLVVGLVGVQSNQFPRGLDLCRAALDAGATVVWGGPHITASINTMQVGISTFDPLRPGIVSPHVMPPEISALLATPGVIVFHGDADADNAWARVLEEIADGTARNYYDAGLAASLASPGGIYDRAYLKSFASPVAAVDTERGCPFKCTFCAAIQAHGRSVRSRDPHELVDWVRRQCADFGEHLTVIFASDNLARNPHWRELLAGLRELRKEVTSFDIWAETDVLCDTGPNRGFLEAYAAAGGRGLFFGIESMNKENLRDAGKTQNNVSTLPALFEKCIALDIAPEGGYIIGFGHDTPESVAEDVAQLAKAGMSRASFFVKTLLPGSQDWIEALGADCDMDPDLNNYDSTIAAYRHEKMSREEWTRTYRDAVRQFYGMRNMIATLSRFPEAAARWRLIKAFLWYRWAYLVENSHPMIAGLYRHRPFAERRRGYATDSYVRHLAGEAWRHVRYVGLAVREFFVFEHVILESEYRVRQPARSEWTARHLDDLTRRARGFGDWLSLTFRLPMRREWLNAFWKRYGTKRWRLLNPLEAWWHVKMLPHALSEVVYAMRFARLFLRGLKT
jgi:radical SAM superfamily enzyme YgiQ (UPF0313 family)